MQIVKYSHGCKVYGERARVTSFDFARKDVYLLRKKTPGYAVGSEISRLNQRIF